jgi:drug/metabolite transporter (DMT)-like permease
MFSDSNLHYELAALGAATCWAVTPLISAPASSHLGALAFNRLRQLGVTLMLAVFVFVTGRWQNLEQGQVIALLASGAVGIFAGDTLLFLALNRLGPRRNSALYALNAPMAAVLGWMFLDESLSLQAVIGIGLTIAGVLLAILYGNRNAQVHALETVRGKLWFGVALAIGAALGQAVGSIIARPVMVTGVDPFLASMLRVGVAGTLLTIMMSLPIEAVKPRNAMTMQMAVITIFSGILAMGLGMTLMLFALSGGKTGIVSTLSATSPVIILPLLWWRTKQRPTAAARAGAALAVFGMALMFSGS